MDRTQAEGSLGPSDILGALAIESVIEPAPEKLPTGIRELGLDGFISQLQARGNLPRTCSYFGYFAYDMLGYLSTAPFYRQPGEQSPSHLTLPQIYRGIFWILPEAHCDIFAGGYNSRRRTVADHRRLLFQSLARTACTAEQHDSVEARQRAARNAYSGIHPDYVSPEWFSVNSDEYGDEIYHDVLDTLFATQPRSRQADPTAPRDSFRELAKAMARGLPKFHMLAIPLKYFTEFIVHLLALQFETKNSEEPVLSQFEEAAKAIALSFCKDREKQIITWPEFDDAFQSMPFLFFPLYRLLSAAFRKTMKYTGTARWIAPKPPPDSFITLSRLSQLATMVNEDLDFENFERIHQWRGALLPAAKVLFASIETMPSVSVLTMCGQSPTGEKIIFGIFIPTFMGVAHPKTVKNTSERNQDGAEHVPTAVEMDATHDWVSGSTVVRPFLFVLAPEQRAIRFKGSPCIIGSHLYFGDALIMSNNGTVSIKYGKGNMRIRTEAVEIWGETTSIPLAHYR